MNGINKKKDLLILNNYLQEMIRYKISFYEGFGYDDSVVVFDRTGSFVGIYKDYITAAHDHDVSPDIVHDYLNEFDFEGLNYLFHYAKDIIDGNVDVLLFKDDSLEEKVRDISQLAYALITK
jgi:hypothetical protein